MTDMWDGPEIDGTKSVAHACDACAGKTQLAYSVHGLGEGRGTPYSVEHQHLHSYQHQMTFPLDPLLPSHEALRQSRVIPPAHLPRPELPSLPPPKFAGGRSFPAIFQLPRFTLMH